MKRSELKRHTPIRRSTTPMREKNPERIARRRKGYKAFLSSAAWKRIRRETFEHDGYQCTAEIWWMTIGTHQRCLFVDETRTGRGLHAHHRRYGIRALGNEIPGEDTTTRCESCHRREHAYEGKRISR